MKNITLLAIDLAKTVFHVCGVNHVGKVVYRKQVQRCDLLSHVVGLAPSQGVVMEACGSSNFWALTFEEQGIKARLIAPQFVKAYRRSQKNDHNDAEAIAETAQRPEMRFVPVKPRKHQETQTLIKIREAKIHEKTEKANRLHAFLLEFGFAAPRGEGKLLKFVKELLNSPEKERLSSTLTELICDMVQELEEVSERLKTLTKKVQQIAKTDELCCLLTTTPGIGAIFAVACSSMVPQPNIFKNGRSFSAWLGIVPRQFTTGGRTVLGRITKSGDSFLRKTIIHGARSVLKYCQRNNDPLSLWAQALLKRKGYNLATVAVANKLARISLRVMVTKEPYNSSLLLPRH